MAATLYVGMETTEMFAKLKSLLGLGEDEETLEAKRRMLAVGADPRCRFVHGVLAVSYDVDPGYLADHSRTAIHEWYGIDNRLELVERIMRYVASRDQSPAYDLYRAMFLARAGEGAGFFSESESWLLAFETGRQLQRTYPGWTPYGMGYLGGHLSYREREGDDPDQIEEYRANILERIARREREIWDATPFFTPL